jgi:hypothetical protein
MFMNKGPGLARRALFALAGIMTAVLFVSAFIVSFSASGGMLLIYAGFVVAGALVVGIPIVLVPGRVYRRLPWGVAIIGGAALGPLALALVFLVIFALQGQLWNFSLAHLGVGWFLSVIASLSAVCVYVELVKRSLARV